MTNSQATLGFWHTVGSLELGPRLARLYSTLLLWRERARERRQLLAMTERELHDLGLSRADAWREADKPLWRP
jgi:uncharacterized protein YjiS (DUF1127 family)